MALRALQVQGVQGYVPGIHMMGHHWAIYTTIMELGHKNHNGDGLLGPNSIMVAKMDPLGYCGSLEIAIAWNPKALRMAADCSEPLSPGIGHKPKP